MRGKHGPMSGISEAGSAEAFTGRTAWARDMAAALRAYLQTEVGSAVVLLAAAVVGLIWANLPGGSYETVWTTRLAVRLGGWGITEELRRWVNDGLMTFFFFVIGLEVRRELDMGELRERRRVAVPVLAALGGMVAPALIYLAINAGGPGARAGGARAGRPALPAAAAGVRAHPGGGRRHRLAGGHRRGLHAGPLAGRAGHRHPVLRSGLSAPLPAVLARSGLFRGRRGAVGGDARVGRAPRRRRGGDGPAGHGLPPATAAPGAGRLADQDVPRATDAGIRPLRAPERRRGHLDQRAAPVPAAPLDQLCDRPAVRARQRRRGAARRPAALRDRLPDHHGRGGGAGGRQIDRHQWRLLAGHPAAPRRAAADGPLPAAGGGLDGRGIGFTVSLFIADLSLDGPRLEEAKIGILGASIVASLLGWGTFRAIARLPRGLLVRTAAATAPLPDELAAAVDAERDHVRGPEEAPVTLVEYGDYECPYCGRAEPTVRELLQEFSEELRYVYRHLPLVDVHPHAELAAEAAEAAGAQGSFWEMHDLLFANQNALEPADLRGYAARLGLDVDRFWDEARSRTYARRVAEDVRSADESGVAGTPTFFVNGRRHEGAYDTETLAAAVRLARHRAKVDAAASRARQSR